MQRFEERLKAAADKAAQLVAIDLDLGDSRRPRHLSRRRRADERDLDPVGGELVVHTASVRRQPKYAIVRIDSPIPSPSAKGLATGAALRRNGEG
jgi:hypothetical protein